MRLFIGPENRQAHGIRLQSNYNIASQHSILQVTHIKHT